MKNAYVDMRGLNFSVHLPIVIDLDINISKSKHASYHENESHSKVSWNSVNEDHIYRYELEMHKLLSDIRIPNACTCTDGKCKDRNHIVELDTLCNDIINACVISGQVFPKCKKKRKLPYWGQNVKPYKDDALFWHNLWKECDKPSNGILYDLMRKTKLQYHYAVRKLKRNSDVLRKEKMAEALNENNSRNFWNEVKKVNDNRIQYPSHVDNITNASDIASLFASKYEALYNSVPSNKTLLNEIYKNLDSDIRNINIHDMQISEVHIVKAFQKIKNDKADSEHKLFSNHLKYAPVSLYRYLACLFNGMIVHGYTPPCIINSNIISIPKDTRGNLSSSENYRGVSLCSSIFKIFELVLIQLQGHNLFTSEMQFAYKEGHSTTMSTLVLKEIANHFINKGSNVYCCFIDASKAFDRLRHDLLFDILYKRGVNPLMIRILMNTFQNQTVQTSWAGIQSKKFTCQNGVRQGGILSPLLYSIYNDILLERLKTNGNGCWMGNHYFGALSYADDLCILSPTLSGLENMLNVCEK
jgi:hypothetical protein